VLTLQVVGGAEALGRPARHDDRPRSSGAPLHILLQALYEQARWHAARREPSVVTGTGAAASAVTAVRWCARCSGGRARHDRARAERQGLTWGAEGDERLKLVLARWTIAMVYALQAHLRRGYDLRAALSVRALPAQNIRRCWSVPPAMLGRARTRACHDVMCSSHQAPSFQVPSFQATMLVADVLRIARSNTTSSATAPTSGCAIRSTSASSMEARQLEDLEGEYLMGSKNTVCHGIARSAPRTRTLSCCTRAPCPRAMLPWRG
jgi:hypothetical protein